MIKKALNRYLSCVRVTLLGSHEFSIDSVANNITLHRCTMKSLVNLITIYCAWSCIHHNKLVPLQ